MCFLASKIELFSSNEDTNMVSDVTSINWEYLGYITLSDNQSTGFKSRELKSANVPKCLISFIKLKLHKNHNNSYNINNQVSKNIYFIHVWVPRPNFRIYKYF